MSAEEKSHAGLKARAAHELREYLMISLYLFICFGAILLYKAAVLRSVGIPTTLYGLAAVKALVMGKFILLGHAAHVGERFKRRALIYPVLYKSFVFLLMLFVLNVIEEALRGWIEGKSLRAALAGFGGGSWEQILAACLLMWLILLPYFAVRDISAALGEGELRRMFFVGR